MELGIGWRGLGRQGAVVGMPPKGAGLEKPVLSHQVPKKDAAPRVSRAGVCCALRRAGTLGYQANPCVRVPAARSVSP